MSARRARNPGPAMTILHVTDLHFNPRWFHWLLHQAPAHDLLVISGDLLDLAQTVPQREQIAWVSRWLSEYPRPLCVCSGQHDLEWDPLEERWHPAYWLRALARPGLGLAGDDRHGQAGERTIGVMDRRPRLLHPPGLAGRG